MNWRFWRPKEPTKLRVATVVPLDIPNQGTVDFAIRHITYEHERITVELQDLRSFQAELRFEP